MKYCDKCGKRKAAVVYEQTDGTTQELCRECSGQERQEITSTEVGKLEDVLFADTTKGTFI